MPHQNFDSMVPSAHPNVLVHPNGAGRGFWHCHPAICQERVPAPVFSTRKKWGQSQGHHVKDKGEALQKCLHPVFPAFFLQCWMHMIGGCLRYKRCGLVFDWIWYAQICHVFLLGGCSRNWSSHGFAAGPTIQWSTSFRRRGSPLTSSYQSCWSVMK